MLATQTLHRWFEEIVCQEMVLINSKNIKALPKNYYSSFLSSGLFNVSLNAGTEKNKTL